MPSTRTKKKYKVMTSCFFMGILWQPNTFVEFDAGVQVPHHFEEIVPPKQEAPPEEKKPAPKKAAPKKTKE